MKEVFLDRDGTIGRGVHYCSCPEDFELLPRAAEAIRMLNHHGFKTTVVTNQCPAHSLFKHAIKGLA